MFFWLVLRYGNNMIVGCKETTDGYYLSFEVEKLKLQGLHFRNEIVKGPGGSQILLIDPSGNFIELFEPKEVSEAQDVERARNKVGR